MRLLTYQAIRLASLEDRLPSKEISKQVELAVVRILFIQLIIAML